MKIIIFNLLLAITIIDGYKIPLIKKREVGRVPLTSIDGIKWHGNIDVGVPPKKFTVLIDTGSSDLILPSIECSTNCEGHNLYVETESSTSFQLNKSATIEYKNGGTIDGEVYTDTVKMAGLTVSDQHFVVSTSYPSSLATKKFSPDGILGLGFEARSEIQQLPFFQILYQTGTLDAAIFGLSLRKSGGSLYLGGVDSAEFQGEITYTPITMEGAWKIGVDSIYMNGKAVITKLNAIVDSGSGPIETDPLTAKNIFDNIPGSRASTAGENMYMVPCDSMPFITFTIGGKPFSIDPTLLILRQEEEGSSYCVCALTGTGNDPNTLILGSVFLQNVYSVFDMKESRIGFADLA
ncbi:unnamed protein product [Cunninghamella echinulata]